jgi:hypothetical protein
LEFQLLDGDAQCKRLRNTDFETSSLISMEADIAFTGTGTGSRNDLV